MDRFTNDKTQMIAEALQQLRLLPLDMAQGLVFQYGESSRSFDPFVISVVQSDTTSLNPYTLYRKVWRQKMDFQRYTNLVYNLDWLKIEEEQCIISVAKTNILASFVKHLQEKPLVFELFPKEEGITLDYPTRYYLYDTLGKATFDTELNDNNNDFLKSFIAFLVDQFPPVGYPFEQLQLTRANSSRYEVKVVQF